jgi:hypothetical protein
MNQLEMYRQMKIEVEPEFIRNYFDSNPPSSKNILTD